LKGLALKLAQFTLLVLVKFVERIPILRLYTCVLLLPLRRRVPVLQELGLSALQDFVDFCVGKGELPEEGIGLVDFQNLQHCVDSVHTVLLPASSALAGDLRTKLNLVLFAVACF
jgi:hypothetical protein